MSIQTATISPPPPPQAGTATPLTPIPFSDRIAAMDIARGVALLGIFVMNIGAFSEPAGEYMVPANPETASSAELVWHLITHALFESKFYTLFSLLFGMGFIILTDRVQARRSSPTAVALRRFGFLAVLGLLHAHLLWFGDILFIYAGCSIVLLFVRRLRASTLIIVGASITAFGELLILSMTLMGVVFATGQPGEQRAQAQPAAVAASNTYPEPPATGESAAPDETMAPDAGGTVAPALADTPIQSPPESQLVVARDATTSDNTPTVATPPADAPPRRGWAFIRDALRSGTTGQSQAWQDAEIAAYREGPWLDLAAFRSVTWMFVLLFVAFGAAPRIVGLFILGAGLIRADFFAPERRRVQRSLVAAATLVGVPIALLAAWNQLHLFPHDGSRLPLSFVFWQAAHELGAILIPMGILGAAALLASRAVREPSGRVARALHPIACTGRMALTNYLTQTLVGTTVCYYYGFAQFGRLDPIDKASLVLGVYCCQVVISTLWLSRFSMGPAEWVWRSFTYLKPAPLRVRV